MTNRRGFLKGTLGIAALAAISARSVIGWAEDKALKLIDMSGKKRTDEENKKAVSIAKGLNYVEDATAADKAGKIKRVEKMGVKGSDQTCANCQFYTEVEKGKSGKCMLIPGVLVHAEGWCNSWTKSPK